MTSTKLDLLVEAREAASTGSGADIRELAGLTQSELARAVRVTPSTVNRWESGGRRPTGDAALRYGRVLRRLAEIVENRSAVAKP